MSCDHDRCGAPKGKKHICPWPMLTLLKTVRKPPPYIYVASAHLVRLAREVAHRIIGTDAAHRIIGIDHEVG